MNMEQSVAAGAAKAAQYGGAGSALVFGLTPSEWSVIGVIGGLLVGVGGLLVTIYFKHKHYKLAQSKSGVDQDDA
jgi:hypothetical protein